MKSAIELAMEKIGGEEVKLTDQQKKEIAEIRARAKAKIAKKEIDFEQRKQKKISFSLEEVYLREELAKGIRKNNEKMEAEIEKVRNRK